MKVTPKITRCERFSFARNESSDQGRISKPTDNQTWPMMRKKHRNDYLTGRADYYWNNDEIAAHTAKIVLNEHGLKCLRYPNNQPVIVKYQKYIIFKDPAYTENHGERLVIGSRFTFHSTIAGGREIKYGGYITTNDQGRKSKIKDADTCTGHYFQAFADVAQDDEERRQAEAFEHYKNQKFSEITDEQVEIGDNSTVPLGMEPLTERLARDFPDEY